MKLLVQPEAGSYAIEFPDNVLSTKLDGGASRYRRDIVGGSHVIPVTFRLNPEDFNYLLAFYREEAKEGAEPFTIDLFVKEAGLTTCTAHFVKNTFKLSEQSGLTYVVTAQLEVELPYDPDQSDDDSDLIDAYNTAHGYTP